jgi:hypothetical protein
MVELGQGITNVFSLEINQEGTDTATRKTLG